MVEYEVNKIVKSGRVSELSAKVGDELLWCGILYKLLRAIQFLLIA